MSDKTWSVVQTKPRSENLAREHLRQQKFKTLFPVEIKKRVVRGKLLEFIYPLFPGYLFVTFDFKRDRDRWPVINDTRGVKRLICSGAASPLFLTRDDIECLIGRCGEPVVAPSGYEDGKRVQIVLGPFADHIGICSGLDEQGRLKVLITFLGSLTAIPVPISSAIPCEAVA
jgi:transcriptional antiterminator RfaH